MITCRRPLGAGSQLQGFKQTTGRTPFVYLTFTGEYGSQLNGERTMSAANHERRRKFLLGIGNPTTTGKNDMLANLKNTMLCTIRDETDIIRGQSAHSLLVRRERRVYHC